jgi:hypothetical protein
MRQDSSAERSPRNVKCSRRAWGVLSRSSGFALIVRVRASVRLSACPLGRSLGRISGEPLGNILCLFTHEVDLDSLRLAICSNCGPGFGLPRSLQFAGPSPHVFSHQAFAIFDRVLRMFRTIRPCLARALPCSMSRLFGWLASAVRHDFVISLFCVPFGMFAPFLRSALLFKTFVPSLKIASFPSVASCDRMPIVKES